MTFGEYLREKRKIKGLNQRVLAQLVDVDVSYICKIESNTLPAPADDCIKKLIVKLGLDGNEAWAMSGRVPDDIKQIMIECPKLFNLIRQIKEKNISIDEISCYLGA